MYRCAHGYRERIFRMEVHSLSQLSPSHKGDKCQCRELLTQLLDHGCHSYRCQGWKCNSDIFYTRNEFEGSCESLREGWSRQKEAVCNSSALQPSKGQLTDAAEPASCTSTKFTWFNFLLKFIFNPGTFFLDFDITGSWGNLSQGSGCFSIVCTGWLFLRTPGINTIKKFPGLRKFISIVLSSWLDMAEVRKASAMKGMKSLKSLVLF